MSATSDDYADGGVHALTMGSSELSTILAAATRRNQVRQSAPAMEGGSVWSISGASCNHLPALLGFAYPASTLPTTPPPRASPTLHPVSLRAAGAGRF